ncbi:NADP-dependent 3-hydroxy acid dehydrogenase YdfG [Lentzea fradiae]|uniref:NADP-dependent 3-hydroxy acid dehydrogenase YdfG n=1 Tax=Lentzea fradiae TaxID=200378 RepID=A0A1G7QKZ9_9PSEU|nr:SDR family oxidoreductase [Lentzea fradiae]SDF98579.1 NADP-dependent 3-hydroxy acid dehydrogenase YdfG [Lentzea fradiae]
MSKVVVISGASSGIGEATARVLAAAGHRVFLGARREDRLAALAAEIGAAHAPLDVTSRESFRSFVDAAVERYGRVDVLVNNAGVMPLSLMGSLKVDEWDRMVDVNLKGVLNGIAAVLPRFTGGGHVVNVASVGAHMVMPTAAVYCATKYAVWALSEGLRQERQDVRVTVVSPGATASELTDGITDDFAASVMEEFVRKALPASAIGEAIAYAVAQPAEVDVNEIVVRPVTQDR